MDSLESRIVLHAEGIRRVAMVTVWVLASMPAAGQVVYKLTDQNGKRVYSDQVIPGMRVVGKVMPPPQPDPKLAAAARAAQAERAEHAADYAKERVRALDAADADITQAEQSLAAAKRALETGAEPLPGERLGTERGTFTRLSDAYWVRMSRLQRQVSKATRDLERAYSERNALRD